MAKDSREHILEVSLMLFLQKSYKAVTMKEIVEKTGLSKGAIYHYFESKEQVFEEVVNHFYRDFFIQDFDSYSYESLAAFCNDYLEDVNKVFLSALDIGKNSRMVVDINHYLLIFDAMAMVPSFKKLNLEHQEKELKSWKKVIQMARKRGEIKTTLTDELAAKMFMYLGDGFGMHVILENNIKKGPQFQVELRKIWEEFYCLLKT
jgi:AcrR family transcriptional regulator